MQAFIFVYNYNITHLPVCNIHCNTILWWVAKLVNASMYICTNTIILKHGIIAILKQLRSTHCMYSVALRRTLHEAIATQNIMAGVGPQNQLLNRLVAAILLTFKLYSKHCDCRKNSTHTHYTVLSYCIINLYLDNTHYTQGFFQTITSILAHQGCYIFLVCCPFCAILSC